MNKDNWVPVFCHVPPEIKERLMITAAKESSSKKRISQAEIIIDALDKRLLPAC